jgi:hypothetical protein
MDGTAAWMIIVWRFGENSPGSNLPPPSMNANGQRGSLSTGSVRILFYFPFISEDDLGKITTPLLFDLARCLVSRKRADNRCYRSKARFLTRAKNGFFTRPYVGTTMWNAMAYRQQTHRFQ